MTEIDKYKCLLCGWRTRRVHRAHYPVIDCKKCGGKAHQVFDDVVQIDPNKRRTPMTEQQKRLIGFYRGGERKWHQDIESRRVAPDGSIVRIPLGKEAPWDRR